PTPISISRVDVFSTAVTHAGTQLKNKSMPAWGRRITMYAHLRRTIPSGVLSLRGRVMAFSLSDC
ncbi:MAG: hypothetical protein ACI3YI_10430, partial [Bacteroidaceae bacterium]